MGRLGIVNLNCTIGHDTTMGDFVTCLPGVHVSGNCKIGDRVMIGSNSVLREHVTIGNDIVVGMGSVVTKDLVDPGVYVGNPCRKLK
jgi:acetyltransferase-like isoleucine patch superfamily enzyme